VRGNSGRWLSAFRQHASTQPPSPVKWDADQAGLDKPAGYKTLAPTKPSFWPRPRSYKGPFLARCQFLSE
jgi:hypothetical protein